MTIHARYVRARDYARLRHSTMFHAFLDGEGARLTTAGPGTPDGEDVFNSLLSGNTADQVRAMTSSDDL